jgi:hypothetical protein
VCVQLKSLCAAQIFPLTLFHAESAQAITTKYLFYEHQINTTGRTHTLISRRTNDLCKYARHVRVCYESADPFDCVPVLVQKNAFSLIPTEMLLLRPGVRARREKTTKQAQCDSIQKQIGRGMHAKLSKSRPLAPRSAGNRGQRCNKFNAAGWPEGNLNLGLGYEFTAQAAANCARSVSTQVRVRVQIIKWPVNYNISGRLTASAPAELAHIVKVAPRAREWQK